MITGVVLTKNEENNIGECLKHLKFCDEVIVIDDNSIDDTRQIAEKFGAKVFVRDLNMDFAYQCNFGIGQAGGDWVLFVDADERVTDALASEISNFQLSNSDVVDGFYVRRRDYMWGRLLKYGENNNQRLMRLIKKGSGKWKRRVHQYFEVEGNVSKLKNFIDHFPHPTVTLFIESVNRWSTWHALANKEEGKKSTLFKICFWPLGHFLKNYFLRFGFLDGRQGFVHAVLMSFHSFLAWGKLWMLQKGYSKV